MCEWGDKVELRVPIAAEASHTGEFRWTTKPVDRCLAPIVEALNQAGLYTGGGCCGHGKGGAYIGLHGGTRLMVDHLVAPNAAVCGSDAKPEWAPGPSPDLAARAIYGARREPKPTPKPTDGAPMHGPPTRCDVVVDRLLVVFMLVSIGIAVASVVW